MGETTLEQVCAFLSGFLVPPTTALGAGEGFRYRWTPAGPWAVDPNAEEEPGRS